MSEQQAGSDHSAADFVVRKSVAGADALSGGASGCAECAWGKVAGCWRYGSRGAVPVAYRRALDDGTQQVFLAGPNGAMPVFPGTAQGYRIEAIHAFFKDCEDETCAQLGCSGECLDSASPFPPKRGPLGYPLSSYHLGRTTQWGNWGITFMERQPDERKNFGVIVGTLYFAVGARGPVDGTYGSDTREQLLAACSAWVRDGTKPAGLVPVAALPA